MGLAILSVTFGTLPLVAVDYPKRKRRACKPRRTSPGSHGLMAATVCVVRISVTGWNAMAFAEAWVNVTVTGLSVDSIIWHNGMGTLRQSGVPKPHQDKPEAHPAIP